MKIEYIITIFMKQMVLILMGEYFSLDELLEDSKVRENNGDIIGFVKDYYKDMQLLIVFGGMNIEMNMYSNNVFEDIKHIDECGNEYWFARELQKVLKYSDWRTF